MLIQILSRPENIIIILSLFFVIFIMFVFKGLFDHKYTKKIKQIFNIIITSIILILIISFILDFKNISSMNKEIEKISSEQPTILEKEK